MAEGVGFEPTVPVKVHTLSRRAQSTALAPLRVKASGVRAGNRASKTRTTGDCWMMAEGVGFEPTVRLNVQRFSRPSRSTTPAPLRGR